MVLTFKGNKNAIVTWMYSVKKTTYHLLSISGFVHSGVVPNFTLLSLLVVHRTSGDRRAKEKKKDMNCGMNANFLYVCSDLK